jgi:hypothetical protein
LALFRGSQLKIGRKTAVVYVGIDLHRRSSHVAAFDEEGLDVLSRRVERRASPPERDEITRAD